MSSDDDMAGPGVHETDAQMAVSRSVPEAQVYATLAVALAINRLAEAVETYVEHRG